MAAVLSASLEQVSLRSKELCRHTVMKKSSAKSHFFVVLSIFLKVLSIYFQCIGNNLLSVGIGYVGSIGK